MKELEDFKGKFVEVTTMRDSSEVGTLESIAEYGITLSGTYEESEVEEILFIPFRNIEKIRYKTDEDYS